MDGGLRTSSENCAACRAETKANKSILNVTGNSAMQKTGILSQTAGATTRKSFREPTKTHPLIHTCIRRLTEQKGMTFDPAEIRKKTDP